MNRGYTRVDWTNEMQQFITDNYKKMLDREIAEIIGIPAHHVKNKRQRMGLTKDKEVSQDAILHGVEAVRNGMTYSGAAKHCLEKFGIKFNISTLIAHCEKAGVVSHKANNEFNPTSQDARKYRELELYNARLSIIKHTVKVGDRIDVMGSGSKTVLEKYPNFVICLNGRFKEAIPYTDIKKVLESKR